MHAAQEDAFADALLVAIELAGVDEDEACSKGRRDHLMREALRGHQMQSEVTRILLEGRRDHLMREALRGHQMQSEVIRCNQRSSDAIRGHPMQSEVIRYSSRAAAIT
jgi:hypothetical protein